MPNWIFPPDPSHLLLYYSSPEAINGAWGSWSPWSHCTRTCGAGIQAAERHWKYCTGERKHYRMCNVKGCQKSRPNFREMQCSEFDTVAYKNEFYQWIPIYNTANPCELQCQPTNQHFSEKMLDAVIDGTPCFEGNSYRDVCINGMCKVLGISKIHWQDNMLHMITVLNSN
uniref:ADAMTS like 1 n=1 Tax=Pseudonaja textilis TaxID=8673 RepID=A0A670ZSH1_PSETE